MTRLLVTDADLQKYDAWVRSHPQGNLWQSLEWKRYQESLGRSVRIYAEEEAGNVVASAMVVIDRTAFGLSTWDSARGPLWTNEKKREPLLEKILGDARQERCMTLYLSAPEKLLHAYHGKISPSHRCEQLEATIVLDLTQSEDQLLAAMHQKCRYNIKVAQKHGVRVSMHRGEDPKALDSLYTLLQETAGRDGFTHLPKSHYEAFLKNLKGSFFLMAWHNEEPIAGLLGVAWKETGFYYYGASSHTHRHLMAPYLLQWETMMHCKQAGCTDYDLLGIAPEDSAKNNPWRGITEFKRKFGGKIMTYPQEQMIVLRPMIKKMLEWKRRVVG